jgi:ATP-dependent Clp protease ATP-binding subunit ClpA
VAPPGYARQADRSARIAMRSMSSEARHVLRVAEREARHADDNHVGTEHVALGLFSLPDSIAARALENLGITRELVSDIRTEEEKGSPNGPIPLTPRAKRIIGLAATAAGGRSIEPHHILLGVSAESKEWEASGRRGPHHLRNAAGEAEITLDAIAREVERLTSSAPSPRR